MAQSTSGQNQAEFQIEVSTDGTTWTDISGSSNSVEVSGGEQITGSQFTADGAVPVVTGGNKTEARTVTVSIIYTETASEGHKVVYDRYVGTDKTIYFRYTPFGDTSGNKRYMAADDAGNAFACPIINCAPPNVDASEGGPTLAEFSLMAPDLLQEAIA